MKDISWLKLLWRKENHCEPLEKTR